MGNGGFYKVKSISYSISRIDQGNVNGDHMIDVFNSDPQSSLLQRSEV
jgi:hypothetical protein